MNRAATALSAAVIVLVLAGCKENKRCYLDTDGGAQCVTAPDVRPHHPWGRTAGPLRGRSGGELGLKTTPER